MPNQISQATAIALQAHFVARQQEMLELTRSLVEAESPSGDQAGNNTVVSLLEAAAKTIASVSSVERIRGEGFGDHLRLQAFGSADEDAAPIVLLGHTDTVHRRGTLAQRPWRAEDNRIYGPGIFDMKANCALAIESLRACEATGTSVIGPVVLVLTCDEENGSPTGRSLVEAETRNARAVLVLEPPASGGRVKTARKGTGMFTIAAHGRAAHAGLDPEKGASAVLEIAHQIVRLHAMNDLASGTSVNAGVVQGGTLSNVVAAEAAAEVDIRFTTLAAAKRLEQDILNLRPVDERVQLSIKGGINRPPLERNEKVQALYEHARRIAAIFDCDLGETSVGGASDGNFVAALGVPVLDGLGIDGDGAHAAHEHILIDNIAGRGALIAGLLATL
jgi:glutamate carboxypeptidase